MGCRRRSARACPLPRARSGRDARVRLLQRCHEHPRLRGTAGGMALRGGSAHARDRAVRRARFLVQRHGPERHRGGRKPGRRILAQHQRHGRPGRGDHQDHRPHYGKRNGRQRGRRWRVPRAGRRPHLGARRHRPESALQEHGQSLRLRVLDLPAARRVVSDDIEPGHGPAAANAGRPGAATRTGRRGRPESPGRFRRVRGRQARTLAGRTGSNR